MKLKILYESDWAIGGHSNPDENAYMEQFAKSAGEIVQAAEEVFALHFKLGFRGYYTRQEVGLRYGAALLTAVNQQAHKMGFPSSFDVGQAALIPDWLQETIYEFRDRTTGNLICYQHLVYGDCGTTYFTVENEE